METISGTKLIAYDIDEWRFDFDTQEWQPWGDCGMCNGLMEPKGPPLKPPVNCYPAKEGDLWVWKPYNKSLNSDPR